MECVPRHNTVDCPTLFWAAIPGNEGDFPSEESFHTFIEQAFSYLDKNESGMMELLKHLVSIESPSSDKDAVEKIAAHLDTYCDALGMERQIHHFPDAGPTFAAWTKSQDKKPILLLGHMDTVHPVGKFGSDPFLVRGHTSPSPKK